MNNQDTRIFEAVRNCCRTRILFPSMHVDELEAEVKDMMIGQWNPLSLKDQTKTLIVEPTETTREVVTRGQSTGRSLGVNKGTSSATAHGRSHADSRQWGASHSHSDAFSFVHSSAMSSGTSIGESVLPSGDIIDITSNIDGNTEVDASGTTTTDTFGEFQSQGKQDSTSVTEINGQQKAFSATLSHGRNQSRSVVPFQELSKHWQWDKTYWQFDEFLTICVQKIKTLPPRHFVIKVPDHKAVFVRAHFVREPWIPNAMRTKALERSHQSLMPLRPEQPALPAPAAYQFAPLALELIPSSAESDPERDDDEWGS